MDKLNAMATFVTIVDSGSLTQAAEALDTSLPTVVRVLAGLEEFLGTRLLNRTTRKIALTDEGRAYLQRCRQILDDIKSAEQNVLDQQSTPAGKLLVSAPLLFGQLHVAPEVIAFLKVYDQVDVDLWVMDRVINLIEEGVDVAIRIGHLSDSSLIAVPVGEIRQVVCASPEFIARHGRPETPQELANHPCVHVTGMPFGDRWPFIIKNKSMHVEVTTTFTCNQAAAVVEACQQGLGFGVFLSYQVQDGLNTGRLVTVLEDYETRPMPVSIIFPHARLLSPRVRVFVDWMKQRLQKRLMI
jgi:DNA-binding transcriptional LysR family regulator